MILSVFLIYLQICPILSWGSLGHSFVARLAQSQLSKTTNQWINDYLDENLSDDLSKIASWPDLILYSDANPIDYNHWQWSRQLHFIDIPDWNCSYLQTRDCVHDRCIEGALKNYSHRLINNDYDYVEQQQALFFLVHFVGDVHQPLHSGFKGDFGGNSIKGYFMNQPNLTNLHAIWDEEIINTRIQQHFQSDPNLYYDYLQNLMFNQSVLINETVGDYVKWISESIDCVCNQVYFDENHFKMNTSTNFILADDYFNRNWPLIDQRLTQGGLRLGLLINKLSENRSRRKLAPQTQALILTSCFALSIAILIAISLYCFSRKRQLNSILLISEDS